jgi:signal transduction histidine kinase
LVAALFNQQEFGVGVCGSDGVLTMMNSALEETMGRPYEPVTDDSWAAYYPLHDEDGRPLPSGGDPLARALRGEQVTDEIVTVRRPGEPVRFIRCNALQLCDEDDGVLGAAVFVNDVTAPLTEQHRLDLLRDRLVTAVNHEVRTPLAVVGAHLELLEDLDEHLPEPARWSLGAMRRAAGRLGQVVRAISEIADESLAVVSERASRR